MSAWYRTESHGSFQTPQTSLKECQQQLRRYPRDRSIPRRTSGPFLRKAPVSWGWNSVRCKQWRWSVICSPGVKDWELVHCLDSLSCHRTHRLWSSASSCFTAREYNLALLQLQSLASDWLEPPLPSARVHTHTRTRGRICTLVCWRFVF